MGKKQLVIYKTWRSELRGVLIFFVLTIASIVLSREVPGSVISGPLLTIGQTSVHLSLPLFWLIPFGWLTLLTVKIYNVRYYADALGLVGYEGILSLSQKVIRVRFEDVRSIETDQTLVERFLGVGDVQVGTAAMTAVELILEGVAAPKDVQDFIQNERDQRQRAEKESTEKAQVNA